MRPMLRRLIGVCLTVLVLSVCGLPHHQHFFDPASRLPSAQATFAATVTFMLQY